VRNLTAQRFSADLAKAREIKVDLDVLSDKGRVGHNDVERTIDV
jgi:hypothetical protein